MPDTVVCPKCKKHFRMGVSGTVDGCDKCTGVKRDRNGYAWQPDEQEQTFAPIETSDDESTWYKVSRNQAFAKSAG